MAAEMREIANWIRRIEQAKPSELGQYYFRVLVPGHEPFEMSGGLIGVTPLGPAPKRPGDSGPECVSIFHLLDVNNPRPTLEVHQQLVSELVALLTLVSDRRVEIAHEVAIQHPGESNTLFLFLGYGATRDRRLHGPLNPKIKGQFAEWLSKAASLTEPHLSALGSACTLHQGSVLLFEKDVRSAYVLLVAGIEVLSREYGSPPTNWSEWDESATWDQFAVELGLSAEQATALRQKLMTNRQIRLKATFRQYGASKLPDSFWDEPWEEWFYPVDGPRGQWMNAELQSEKRMRDILPEDRQLLSKCLGRSYDIRSGLVHRGDQLRMQEAALGSRRVIETPAPLPFPVLRSVLLALIKEEIKHYGSEIPLPDLHFHTPT